MSDTARMDAVQNSYHLLPQSLLKAERGLILSPYWHVAIPHLAFREITSMIALFKESTMQQGPATHLCGPTHDHPHGSELDFEHKVGIPRKFRAADAWVDVAEDDTFGYGGSRDKFAEDIKLDELGDGISGKTDC